MHLLQRQPKLGRTKPSTGPHAGSGLDTAVLNYCQETTRFLCAFFKTCLMYLILKHCRNFGLLVSVVMRRVYAVIGFLPTCTIRVMQSLYPQAVKALSPTPPNQHSLEHSSAGGMGNVQSPYPPIAPPSQRIRSEAEYVFQQPKPNQFATSGTKAMQPSQFGNMKTGNPQQVGYGRLKNSQSVFGPSGISGPDPLNSIQQPIQKFSSPLSGPGMKPGVGQASGDWSKPPSSQQFRSNSVQGILSRPFSCTSFRTTFWLCGLFVNECNFQHILIS